MIEQPRNACPNCGKPISFLQLVFGAEKFAIKCRQCGARLSKRTRAIAIGIASGVIASGVARSQGYLSQDALIGVAVALAITALVAWFTVRVKLAGDEIPDPPTSDARFEVRDGPPPHDPHFRGSNGPPPAGKD